MDFVIASLHRSVYTPNNKANHTQALIKAMENPNVHIIGHPIDVHYDLDIKAVAEAAARTLTILEINNQSLNPIGFRYEGEERHMQLLELCKQYGIPVLAGSDAHFCTEVGEMWRAITLIEAVGLPCCQVLNTDVELLYRAIGKKRESVNHE